MANKQSTARSDKTVYTTDDIIHIYIENIAVSTNTHEIRFALHGSVVTEYFYNVKNGITIDASKYRDEFYGVYKVTTWLRPRITVITHDKDGMTIGNGV